MKTCISCGMPMKKKTDFPSEDVSKDYCVYCARPDGSMQSFEEKKEGMIAFVIREQGFDAATAIKIVEQNMSRLPAWKDCFVKE